MRLGMEVHKEPWPLYELMSFLAPVIKPRRKRTLNGSGMSLDGGEHFGDYTYTDDTFNASMLANDSDIKPGFGTNDTMPVAIFNPTIHDNNEAIASSTSQYIKISSPVSSHSSQNYMRSRSTSPMNRNNNNNNININNHQNNSEMGQLMTTPESGGDGSGGGIDGGGGGISGCSNNIQDHGLIINRSFNSQTPGVSSSLLNKPLNVLERNQFKTFGDFIGDHLSSMPYNNANLLMKNIMQEIINFQK